MRWRNATNVGSQVPGPRPRSARALRRLSRVSAGQERRHRVCPRSLVELGVEPQQPSPEPTPISSTPHYHPMQWGGGIGTEFRVTTRRFLSLSLTLLSSLLPLGEVGREGCPSARSPPAQITRARSASRGWGRAGAGEGPTQRRSSIPKEPSLRPGLVPSAV